MEVEKLVGNLMSYELGLENRKGRQANEKKSLAFIATSNDRESDDNDNIDFMNRNFKKSLKYRKINDHRD